MSFYLRIGERVEGPFTTGEVQSRLARQVGMTTRKFTYLVAGPNEFEKGTNVHMLTYQSIPPFGKACYVFEEKRWGFYD